MSFPGPRELHLEPWLQRAGKAGLHLEIGPPTNGINDTRDSEFIIKWITRLAPQLQRLSLYARSGWRNLEAGLFYIIFSKMAVTRFEALECLDMELLARDHWGGPISGTYKLLFNDWTGIPLLRSLHLINSPEPDLGRPVGSALRDLTLSAINYWSAERWLELLSEFTMLEALTLEGIELRVGSRMGSLVASIPSITSFGIIDCDVDFVTLVFLHISLPNLERFACDIASGLNPDDIHSRPSADPNEFLRFVSIMTAFVFTLLMENS